MSRPTRHLLRGTRLTRPARYVLIVATASTLVLGLLLAQSLNGLRAGVQAQEAGPAPGPTAASLGSLSAVFDNPILGYRIDLPSNYRRAGSSLFTGNGAMLGRDIYTFQSEAEARAECLGDGGGTPDPTSAKYMAVEAYKNAGGQSALQWATARRSPRGNVEPVTIAGREAARLGEDGITYAYAIRGDDRVYLVTATTWPSQHPLDLIVGTFSTTTPPPFPAAAPVLREAARALATSLSQGFAARDANAVGRLIQGCRLGVSALIDGIPTGGVLNRSVSVFTDGLRTRFATGDLQVVVDTTVQVQAQRSGPDRLYVRSDWTEPGRTTQIDLYFDRIDGQWLWVGAVQHFRRGQISKDGCIPYHTPWVPVTSC